MKKHAHNYSDVHL